MHLGALTKEDCETVRLWRNVTMDAYRTPFLLTKEMQEDFYHGTVCNRLCNSRYWGVYSESLLGMVGLVNISWENRHAELSIVVDPERRREKVGESALNFLLIEGLMSLNLNMIYGEAYKCNSSIEFWEYIIKKFNCYWTTLPQRKYLEGKYWDSLYFVFNRDNVRYAE